MQKVKLIIILLKQKTVEFFLDFLSFLNIIWINFSI